MPTHLSPCKLLPLLANRRQRERESLSSHPPSTHIHTGCNAVRFWLHIDGSTSPEFDSATGLVTGISEETVDDLKWVLKVIKGEQTRNASPSKTATSTSSGLLARTTR